MSQKSLKFHIKSDDYFGTVATALSLINQQPKKVKDNEKYLDEIIKDLMFLQKEYKIVKK